MYTILASTRVPFTLTSMQVRVKFCTNSHETDNSVASIQQVLAHDTGGLGWLNNVSGLILSVPTEAEYILKMMN
jgi:hypothetical protein